MKNNPFEPLSSLDRLWGVHQDKVETLRDNPRRLVVDISRLFLSCRIPVTTWGPVGARKTRTWESMSREVDHNGTPYQVIVVQPSTIDSTVIHGMFYTTQDAETGETIMLQSIPDIAKRVMDYYNECGGYTIMLLDEMTTCQLSQQNAMLGLLTHGTFGSTSIAQYCTFVMAANPEGTVSQVNELSEALINRGGHVAWYGDPELFLEEWSDGFGIESLKPDPTTEWYIRELIEGSMEQAFRSDKWSPDDLVPWDLYEHSERTTTDLSTLITHINRIMANVPQDIRHYYIIKVTEALQGKKWASRMEAVCKRESRSMNTQMLKDMVTKSGVTETSQTVEALGISMYKVSDGSRELRQDEINELTERLMKEFTSTSEPAPYVTLWAMASTAPNAGVAASIRPVLFTAMQHAGSLFKEGKFTKEQAVPSFATEEMRTALRVLGQNL